MTQVWVFSKISTTVGAHAPDCGRLLRLRPHEVRVEDAVDKVDLQVRGFKIHRCPCLSKQLGR